MKVAITDTDVGPIYVSGWVDNGITYSISTAFDARVERFKRKFNDGTLQEITVPGYLKKYQTGIQRVNTHNQLHLATQYSLLESLVLKVWYKVFYIGMVDMALTNTYILYNHLHNEN